MGEDCCTNTSMKATRLILLCSVGPQWQTVGASVIAETAERKILLYDGFKQAATPILGGK